MDSDDYGYQHEHNIDYDDDGRGMQFIKLRAAIAEFSRDTRRTNDEVGDIVTPVRRSSASAQFRWLRGETEASDSL